MYYHINFIIESVTNAETVVKADTENDAVKQLYAHWNKIKLPIEIIDIRESKYLAIDE